MQFKKKCIIFIRSTILVALVGAIIGVGVYGCKKEEPLKENVSAKTPVSLEGNLENTKIVFISWRDENPEIYVMNVDGTEQKRLTNNPAEDTGPAWSLDGKRIAFALKKRWE